MTPLPVSQLPPTGIIKCLPPAWVEKSGGLRYVRYLKPAIDRGEKFWHMSFPTRPRFEVLHLYVVFGGFVQFRVLRPDGVLVFKWSEAEIPIGDVLALTTEKPLFGHRSGKAAKTHWICFLKSEAVLTTNGAPCPSP